MKGKGIIKVNASGTPDPVEEEFLGRNSTQDAGTESFEESAPDDYFGNTDISADLH